MGVPQTLKKLGPLCRESNLYDVARGRIVGFDGHVLLHHFVYAAASDIVHRNDFRPLAKMVRQRCQVIRGHGVTPLVVFDGGRLPIKQQTNEARARARAQADARVQFELDPSPQALAAAAKLTDEAVREVISELSEHGIAHVVAPYEADAQLAWMSDQGLIWAAATVDSDFVMHGVKRIFFKVDYHLGNCFLVDMEQVLSPESWPDLPAYNTDFMILLAAHGVNFLLAYALCAGCDYDSKVKNIGPGRAVDAIKLVHGENALVLQDLEVAMPLLAQKMAERGGDPGDIRTWPVRAKKALIAFQHALIYDLRGMKMTTKTGEHCVTACERYPFSGRLVLMPLPMTGPGEQRRPMALGMSFPHCHLLRRSRWIAALRRL